MVHNDGKPAVYDRAGLGESTTVDGRRTWSPPTVIVSDIGQSGAGVSIATDFTTTFGYQIGS